MSNYQYYGFQGTAYAIATTLCGAFGGHWFFCVLLVLGAANCFAMQWFTDRWTK